MVTGVAVGMDWERSIGERSGNTWARGNDAIRSLRLLHRLNSDGDMVRVQALVDAHVELRVRHLRS